MGRYHDQKLIDDNCIGIQKLIKDGVYNSVEDFIEVLSSFKESADYEFGKISVYTAPEVVTQRTQAVYYYEDLIERLRS